MQSRYQPKQYELPDKGSFHGVISAVKYKPNVQTWYGVKNRVSFIISTDQQGEDDQPIPVTITHNDSLHKRSGLYEFILQMTRKAPEPGYDFDNMLGIAVEGDIVHNQSEEARTWANAENLRRAATGKERAAEEASDARVKQAIAKHTPTKKKKTAKDATNTKSQWDPKKPHGYDGPLFTDEELGKSAEIQDSDCPF